MAGAATHPPGSVKLAPVVTTFVDLATRYYQVRWRLLPWLTR